MALSPQVAAPGPAHGERPRRVCDDGSLDARRQTASQRRVYGEGKLSPGSPPPGEIKLWDAATLTPLTLRLEGATGEVFTGALSRDGKLIAAGCRDRKIRRLQY